MVNIRKPKQIRAKNTYNSIILAGFISVKKHGLKHTTVLKICDIAGVGSGSFYEYFKNKDALFEVMQAYFFSEISTLIFQIIPRIVDKEIPDAIREIFSQIVELLSNNENTYFYWVSESREYVTEINYGSVIKALNALAIEYAIRHPEVLKIKNLRLMVYIIVNASVAITMSFFASKQHQFKFEDLVDCLVNLVMSYIKNKDNIIL